MSQPHNLELIRRVNEANGEFCLEIGTHGDNPALIELRTADKKSIEWFGPISITMEPDYALLLGTVLINAAQEKLARRSRCLLPND